MSSAQRSRKKIFAKRKRQDAHDNKKILHRRAVVIENGSRLRDVSAYMTYLSRKVGREALAAGVGTGIRTREELMSGVGYTKETSFYVER